MWGGSGWEWEQRWQVTCSWHNHIWLCHSVTQCKKNDSIWEKTTFKTIKLYTPCCNIPVKYPQYCSTGTWYATVCQSQLPYLYLQNPWPRTHRFCCTHDNPYWPQQWAQCTWTHTHQHLCYQTGCQPDWEGTGKYTSALTSPSTTMMSMAMMC